MCEVPKEKRKPKMKIKNSSLCIFFIVILTVSMLEIMPAAPLSRNPENKAELPLNTTGIGAMEEYNETYHGYVRVSPEDPRFLVFDDGTPFYPVGINTGWWFYESQAQNMKAHNINLGRVWMCSWHVNIEPQLKVYSESAATQLDNILALAEEYDIYIQLVLLTFTDFSNLHGNHWDSNPYNADNGGPCENPADFFTDLTARDYIKKRFNYILNRWGNNSRIAIWEFWNEVNLVGRGVDPYVPVTDAMVKAWQEDVAQVFRQNDTHHRPLATSCSGDVFWDQTFLSDANDVIQIHTYNQSNPNNLALQVSEYIKQYENSGKPVVIGEYGINSEDKVEFLHSGLWAALTSGSGYSSMWWQDPSWQMSAEMWDRYLHFAAFIRDVPWPSLNISAGTGNISGATDTSVFGIQGDGFALAWIQHNASSTVSGAKLEFSGLSSGNYTVHIYEDSTGTYVGQYFIESLNGELAVDLPSFIDYLAVKVIEGISPITVRWKFDAAANGVTYNVVALSNSSLTNFNFSRSDKKISFGIKAPPSTMGFCNVTVPKALLKAEPSNAWNVLLDSDQIYPLITENSTHTFLYFTYNQTAQHVEIIGTQAVSGFPVSPLPFLLLITALAIVSVILVKKYRQKRINHTANVSA